jgi:hypothetical protein
MTDMENRNTILNELKEISPVVAQIGFQLPYQVPAGYFEGLPEQILARVKGSEEEGSPVLGSKKDNPYHVPQGYFENFAANILQRIKANEAQTAKDELEALSPLLSGLSKKTPFSTPAGYFEELTDNAVAGARAIDFVNEELENLSPLMNSLKGKNVYEVPAGYFEQLPEQVLQRAKKQPGKTVSMNFTRRIVRYAAAAVVAGLIITAAWLYLGNGGNTIDPALAGIEEVSEEDLQNFIENQTVNPAETSVIASVNVEMDAEDLQEMLADVSDEELMKYLDQFGAKDNLTN